ncbi:hypothetical protein [Nostoc sp. JL33]|uniref:hypothetical protein n=1 Tax=Nostoc sp. JL33 TaxID=2815396 RepID=UPI0025E8BCC5|nr:hypothetical protein [Nostoc sp. JL33]
MPKFKQPDLKLDLYICNSSLNVGKITEVWQTCFTVEWNGEIKCYFWERDEQVISELAIAPQALVTKFFSQGETLKAIEENQPQVKDVCVFYPDMERTQQLRVGEGLRPTIGQRIRITKTRTQNLSQWIGYEATVTGINDETISVAAGEGREKKHLTLKKGWYEVIPENFLEESQPQPYFVQKPKGRQRKGCLYRYIENKKLKDGAIASYPRVIGHRYPDNPTHWRWGFNWEEKIDGEWKGRSIGSVPLGAIALVQSMQKEGVSLEEIIGFIRRAKAKK